MAKNPTKKENIQKNILRFLSEKTAIPLKSIQENKEEKEKYALNRSIKNLSDLGLVEICKSPQQKYLKITKEGKKKLNTLKLENEEALISFNWDGNWRIIILDLPEKRKKERDALRYLLKKAKFVCIKNTVWVSPYPYEHLFENIKEDMNLENELMIIVTDKIDKKTKITFFEKVNEKF